MTMSWATARRPPRDARVPCGAAGQIIEWVTESGLETPVLLFSTHALAGAVRALRLGLGARISYATKANSHPLMVTELAGLIEEFNVTNVTQLDQVLAAGVDPGRITWLHPVTAPRTLAEVLDRGVRRFVVDDLRGAEQLIGTGAEVVATLRILPPEIGQADRSVVRFGNDPDSLVAVARRLAAAGVGIEALSFFVGTAHAGPDESLPFRRGIEVVAALRERLLRDGIDTGATNLGGGFPGNRRRFHTDHPEFFPQIRHELTRQFGPDATVICEPGRYLAEPTLTMVTRAIADRITAGHRLVYLDASAYSGLFESSFIDPDQPMTIWTAGAGRQVEQADLLGPIMDSFDVVRRGSKLPRLREGELLVLPNIGAYSIGYMTRCEGLSSPRVVPLPEDIDSALAREWFA
jgi:diaminopimelate decarboxylase